MFNTHIFRKHLQPQRFSNVLALAGLLIVFIAVPLTVIVVQKSENEAKSPKAAVTDEVNTVDMVLRDMTANHDGKICGVEGYDWELHAANQGGVPGSGFTRATGWGVFQWDCNAGPVANVTVETQNIRAYVFNGSWNLITDHVGWCSLTDQTTATNVGDCPGGGLTGPNWQMPNSKVALHWASDHNTIPAGVTCSFTTLQARISGSGASGAYFMGGSGFDYWNTANTAIDASFVGRYRRLTTSWLNLNGTSCSASVIQNNPPPGLSSGTPVDNPPTVSIATPANGATITPGTNVDINATATDDIGVNKVEISVDGAVRCTDLTSPYTCAWDTTGLTGIHTIYAKATDSIGQITQSSTITVTVGSSPSTCNTTFPTNKFHVCFFNSINPSTGVFLGERDEGTVTSLAPTSATPILHDYLTGGEFGVTDNFSGVWRGTLNFPNGSYVFTATGDDGLRLDIGDDGTYEINQWIDQSKTSYQSNPITLNGATKVRFEWYENQYDAYTSLGWGLVSSAKPGDVNGDNRVNSTDLAAIVSRWATTDTAADLNHSGKVDSGDLAILIANWGR